MTRLFRVMGCFENVLPTFLFGCLMLLASCSDEFYKESQREFVDECIHNLIQDPDILEEHLVGKWQLEDFACGFCDGGRKQQIFAKFTPDGGRLIVLENYKKTEDISFTWESYVDSRAWGTGPAARIKTTPGTGYLNNMFFCDRFMFQDGRVNDGPYIVMEKRD